MQAIRKRNPFTFQSEDHGDGPVVLDEQGDSFSAANNRLRSAPHRTGRARQPNQGGKRLL